MLLITTFYLIRVSHTRNSSPPPFHPGVSHPEFLSAAISSGCLTPGIPLRHHSIRMSHTQNSPPPPFHPGVSHPKFFSAAIPSGCLTPGILLHHHSLSGCLTPGILLCRHSSQVSHTRNLYPPPFHPDASHPESYPPTFHLPRMPHIRNPIRRRSTFFFILRAFSLGSKITFLIKLCCHFHF